MSGKATSDVIELNVGGTIFASSRGTLTRISDSMLARLVDGDIPSARDSQGRYAFSIAQGRKANFSRKLGLTLHELL